MKSLVVVYTPHSRHKHSVRVTPTVTDKTGNMKLPDLYVTHDVLKHLEVDPQGNFMLGVTFTSEAPK